MVFAGDGAFSPNVEIGTARKSGRRVSVDRWRYDWVVPIDMRRKSHRFPDRSPWDAIGRVEDLETLRDKPIEIGLRNSGILVSRVARIVVGGSFK